MDFDFDDPALNAMLGVPEEQASVGGDVKKAVDLSQLDRQFIELVKTSIAPRLYAILSDLSVIESGRDSGVPDLTNKAGYIDSVAELWALCAVVLVQKNQRDWSCYMEPFGKESWHRFANVLRRWEIACTFSCLMLANDGKAYKVNSGSRVVDGLFS